MPFEIKNDLPVVRKAIVSWSSHDMLNRFRFNANSLGKLLDHRFASHSGDGMASLHWSDHGFDDGHIGAMFHINILASMIDLDGGSSGGKRGKMRMRNSRMNKLRISLTFTTSETISVAGAATAGPRGTAGPGTTGPRGAGTPPAQCLEVTVLHLFS